MSSKLKPKGYCKIALNLKEIITRLEVKASLTSDCIAFPSFGLVRDMRLTGSGIIVAGLALEDRDIHLSVFERGPEESRDTKGRIYHPLYRRRNID